MMKDVSLFDAALLALGGGLMLLGGSHATRGESHQQVSPGPAALTVVGMGVMVYAAYRIRPGAGAALGAVLLTVAFINDHRRSLGMPDLVPGIALPGAGEQRER